jgi:hypothetical protein
MKKKRYLSVVSMVRDMGDQKLADAVEQRIESRHIRNKKKIRVRLDKIKKLVAEVEELLLYV